MVGKRKVNWSLEYSSALVCFPRDVLEEDGIHFARLDKFPQKAITVQSKLFIEHYKLLPPQKIQNL